MVLGVYYCMNKSYKGLPSICILASQKNKGEKDDSNFHCTFLHSVKYIFVLENKGLGTGIFPETQRQEGLDSPDSAICISGVGAGDRILPATGKVQTWHEAGGKLLAGCSALYDILHSDSRAWKIPTASCIQSEQR